MEWNERSGNEVDVLSTSTWDLSRNVITLDTVASALEGTAPASEWRHSRSLGFETEKKIVFFFFSVFLSSLFFYLWSSIFFYKCNSVMSLLSEP